MKNLHVRCPYRVFCSAFLLALITRSAFGAEEFSITYNLRVGETTRRSVHPIEADQPIPPSVLLLSPFEQRRTRFVGPKSHATGLLASYSYSPHPPDPSTWFIRTETAFGTVFDCSFADSVDPLAVGPRTQMDDILVSGGLTHAYPSHDGQFTVSGMGHLGIPTHKDRSPFQTQIGVGHPMLGWQLDIGYTHDMRHAHNYGAAESIDGTILGVIRYLHFFPTYGIGVPPGETVTQRLQIFAGDVIDLFIAYNISSGPWSYEFGYNPTFISNIFSIPQPAGITSTREIRSNFFGTCSYLFPIRSHTSGISGGISYGYDFEPFDAGYRQVLLVWLTWGLNF